MRRSTKLSCRLVVVVAALAGGAAANGRFPRAQQLVVDPANPDHLMLRSTYGLLLSEDAGQKWSWVCEQSVGYSGSEDPGVGITKDGALLAGMFDGLAVSHDRGCDFAFVGGGLDARYVVDLSVEKQNPAHAVAMVSMGVGTGTFLNQVWQTVDDAKTWTQLGPDAGDDFLSLTIDSAPSDPDVLYASGLASGQGILLHSTDHAGTWQRTSIDGSDSEHTPFIGAVDPNDPSIVYVRLNGTDEDVLLRSTDAGQTWQELLRGKADLTGFALSPDGATVAAGFNDPGDETVWGLWRAASSDLTFSHVYTSPIACLTWTAAGLYACTSQFKSGFELGISADDGKTFEAVMHLTDLSGPLECAADTSSGKFCPPRWQAVCETIGKCTGGSGGDAGTVDGGSGGGGTGSGATGGSDVNGQPGGDAGSGGCGCRAPGGGGNGTGALGVAIVALLLHGAGRRRR